MKTLIIERLKGQRREWQSIGWKRPKEGDCRRQFFAQDANGRPVVLTPVPAAPDAYIPGYPAVFSGEPFPEAVCVEISPCRLLAPPCFESQRELDAQFPAHTLLEPWIGIYGKQHRQFMVLEAADDGPLQQRLDQYLKAMRAACERDKGYWEKEIARLTTGSLDELKLASEEARQKLLAEARGQLAYVESETQPILSNGQPDVSAGWLKLTLDDIRRGALSIRDAYLHEQWAKDQGEDLETMAVERLAFCKWLKDHTGTPANIIDMEAKEKRKGVNPPRFGERFENNPQFLEACAKVKYRARFADNASTVVYLADIEEREELDAAELEEVRLLLGGQMSECAPATKADVHGVFKVVTEFRDEHAVAHTQAVEERAEIKAGLHDMEAGLGMAAASLERTQVAVAEAKSAAEGTKEAVVAKFIPQYENLQAVKEEAWRKAALDFLRMQEMPPLDREILTLRWSRNLSHDAILNDLRSRGLKAHKAYVGKVLNDYNALLKAKGFHALKRITGRPLPPKSGYAGDQRPEATTEDTPLKALMENDGAEMEAATTVAAWRKGSRKEKETLERHYKWLAGELKQAGEKPVTEPK